MANRSRPRRTSPARSSRARRESGASLRSDDLLEIHLALSSFQDLAPTADYFLDTLLELLCGQRACLLELREHRATFVRGRGEGTYQLGADDISLDMALVRRSIDAGQPRSGRAGEEYRRAIPLPERREEPEIRDVVYLSGDRPLRRLPVRTRNLLLKSAADSLRKARTVGHLRIEETRLTGLYQLAVAAATEPDLRGYLARALDVVIAQTDGDRGFITLFDSDGASSFVVGADAAGQRLPEDAFGVDFSLAAGELRAGRSVESVLVEGGPGRGGRSEVRHPNLIPLRLDRGGEEGPRVLGAIYVDRRQRGTESQRSVLRVLANQIATTVERFHLRETEEDRLRIEDEIRQAEKVQALLLPRRIPDLVGFAFDVEYHLSRGLGGDYYDFVEMEGDRVGIAIADVLGHSVSSAIVMSTCRTLLREYCRQESSPARILGRANDTLERDLPDDMFVTLFLAVVDLRTFQIVYANAGQCYPLHFRSSDRDVQVLAVGGLPLGFQRGAPYREAVVDLGLGDILVLYTDGVTESRTEEGQPLGVNGLTSIVRRVMMSDSPRLAQGIYRAISSGSPTKGRAKDDFTLLTIRMARETRREHWEIPSTESAVREAVERAEQFAREEGFISERFLQFRLVLTEALTNAIEHGNHRVPSRRINVLLTADERRMSIRIRDEGDGYDVERVMEQALDPDFTSARGRGLTIIKRYVESVQVTERGNTITLAFSRSTF